MCATGHRFSNNPHQRKCRRRVATLSQPSARHAAISPYVARAGRCLRQCFALAWRSAHRSAPTLAASATRLATSAATACLGWRSGSVAMVKPHRQTSVQPLYCSLQSPESYAIEEGLWEGRRAYTGIHGLLCACSMCEFMQLRTAIFSHRPVQQSWEYAMQMP